MADANGTATLAKATPRADLEDIAKWEAERHRWLLRYGPGLRSKYWRNGPDNPLPSDPICPYCGAQMKLSTTWRAALIAMRKTRKGRAALARKLESVE